MLNTHIWYGRLAPKIWHLFLLPQQINNSCVFTPDTEEQGGAMQTHTGSWNQAHNAAATEVPAALNEKTDRMKRRESEGKNERVREITWRTHSLFLWHSCVAPVWEDNLSLLQSQSAIHTITYNINQSAPSNGFWRAAPLYGLQSNPHPLMHLLTLL